MIETIRWTGTSVRIIDQKCLPLELVYLDCKKTEDIARAIEDLSIRGAPAIGIAAAYGVVLGSREIETDSLEEFKRALKRKIKRIESTRPTAVNLFWATERMERMIDEITDVSIDEARKSLLEEAERIHNEDKEICRRMGKNGAELLKDGMTVLTHCNAGALATADFGTALGVIYAANRQGKKIKVFADETRPLLQGARLTAWELSQNGIEVTLICDNMAPWLMKKGMIDCVIVGADRIASNGDVANKIGTYGVALSASKHGIPFYVAAPISTIDLNLKSGEEIPIEERRDEEITVISGKRIAPEGIKVYNPAFDVTPNEYVTAIISEKGIARPPYNEVFKKWI